MSMRKFLVLSTAVALLTLLPVTVLSAVPEKDTDDDAERAQKAAQVLNEVMATTETGIPDYLMERAEAIAVFPNVVKGAFGIGGRYGKGLIVARKANRAWGTPSFMKISGGSVGFQIGVTSTDLVLVFTDKAGVKSLLDGKLKLGADASVAAGPVGRHAEASTDVKLKSGIYSYSRSKGLFAGLALDGAVLNINDSANQRVFGKNVSGTDILVRGSVPTNSVVMPFVRAVEKYTSRKTS